MTSAYAGLLLLVICQIACQPTPEVEPVQNRKDGTLEQVIVATPAPTYAPEEFYEAPTRWVEELEFRGEKIYIDANVEVPEGSAFEVLTITTNEFDKSSTLSILQSLLGDNLELREQQRSYDELLTDLQNTQKGWFVGMNEGTGEAIWEPYEGQEQDIKELKELLAKTSPDESFVSLDNEMEFPTSLRLIRTKTGKRWYMSAKAKALLLRTFRNADIQTEEAVLAGGAYPGEKGHALEVTDITEEEAIEAAFAFIAPLQKAEMAVAIVEKARVIEDYTYNILHTGYYITLVGNPANTIPCNYLSYSGNIALDFTQEEESSYAKRWVQEEMQVFVSSQGVQSFYWAYRKKVVGVANKNVQLMPFEQVQERIRTLLEYGVREGNQNPIYISRIVLSSAIEQIPNQGDEAFMTPAWMIFFTTELDRQRNRGESIMILSALDGSYISPVG